MRLFGRLPAGRRRRPLPVWAPGPLPCPPRHPGQDPQRRHRRRGSRTFRHSAGKGPALRGPCACRTRVRRAAGPQDRGGVPVRRARQLPLLLRRPARHTGRDGNAPAPGPRIEPSSVEWDSWRRPDGSWNVVARFEAPSGAHAAIGEEPPAMWTFSPARKSLQNANRWAQQLSELEPIDGPVPARRLSAVSDRPFDFETDAEAAARTATAQLSVVHPFGAQQEKDADGLLDMLRSRRGHRLGLDEDADDALALLLTNGVPAAHPRPSEVPPPEDDGGDHDGDDSAKPAARGGGQTTSAAKTEPHAAPRPDAVPDAFARRRDARPSMLSRLSLAPRHQDNDDGDDALKLHDGVSTETREITIAASQLRPVRTGPTSSPGLDELLGGGPSRRAQGRPPRPRPGPPAAPIRPTPVRPTLARPARTCPAQSHRAAIPPATSGSRKPRNASPPSPSGPAFPAGMKSCSAPAATNTNRPYERPGKAWLGRVRFSAAEPCGQPSLRRAFPSARKHSSGTSRSALVSEPCWPTTSSARAWTRRVS